MSIRTIRQVVCDGCQTSCIEPERTMIAELSFGKVRMVETYGDNPKFREGAKRRDYCEACVESDIFFCERCKTPHQFECPVDADEWWEVNAGKMQVAELEF